MQRPRTVVFDVNETLSDLGPLAARFAEVGAPPGADRLWFAGLLRDGFALSAVGAPTPFAQLAAEQLRCLCVAWGVPGDLDAAAEHILDGLAHLGLHPDVADGVRALAEGGLRLVTLTNGSVEATLRLLSTAGLREVFSHVLSVQDAGAWKPDPRAYAYAARSCGEDPGGMVMVAVHPWDIDGAQRAGLRAAWIDRSHGRYPGYFRPPQWQAHDLSALAAQLTAVPA